jgi:hypothetical protein
MTRKSTIVALLASLLVASVTASLASQGVSASEQRSRPPKVIQLSYGQWYEEPGGSLAAFARGSDSLRFTTRYRGRQASVPAKQTGLFDTNLPRCCNQGWEPIRHQGAARVYRLIRKALNRRGVAKVRTRAKRDRHVEDQRWRIVLAQCSQDPPSYPVDCEIAPNGEHY